MNSKQPRNLLLVDGHYFLHRAFAVPFSFSSKKGTPLHVVNTYLGMVRRAVRTLDLYGGCQYLSVVFDTPTTNSNYELYADYKAGRTYEDEEGDTPFEHLPQIQKSLTKMGINWLEVPGHEADDVVATLATRHVKASPNNVSFLATIDTDFFQLLNSRVRMLKLMPQGKHEVLVHHDVEEKVGVSPRQYVRYKAMVGDSSDNIPGVPGIGPKRACEVIKGERELDRVEHAQILDRNEQLIRLNREVPLTCRKTEFKYDNDRIMQSNQDVFSQCGF